MRTFRLIAVFAFAAIFAVSAFAQTAPTFKIGVINTAAFDADKAGITKYVTAANSLETEFKQVMFELQTMANKYQALQTELQTAQANAQKNPNVPIDNKSLQAKADEYEKLGRELKFKQEDAKARYERREAVVLAPIRQDIGNAIQEFTKKNGYALILDAAKLDGAGLLLGFDEKYDVTKDFITFYNSRPAATASATVPK
jgi:Skp family chaperone for outer membrane proteins